MLAPRRVSPPIFVARSLGPIWRPTLAGAMALVLTGCLPREALDPTVDVPGAYRSAAAAPSAPLRSDWWRQFRSAELTRLAEETQIGNFEVAIAAARVRQAEAEITLAEAPLFPTLSGTADASRRRSAALGGSRPDGRNSYSLALQAGWELDLWGKNRALAEAALRDAEAARATQDAVALTALAGTASTYFTILANQDRKRIAQDNLASATRVLTLIRERLAAGTATALDTAQQETIVAQLKAAIPPLDQAIEQDSATLAVFLGRAPERLTVRGGGMGSIAIPAIAPGLPSQLLVRRPDIQAAEARLAAGNADVAAARAAFLPTISLTGQDGLQSLALKSLFNPSASFYSIAAGLTQPIFDGGRLQGNLALQRGRQEELLQSYRSTVITAFADVDRALSAVRQLARQEQLQRDAVESSRRAFTISEQRLREGTVDLVTVLNTQQTLFQAQDALTRVRLARLLAAVSLTQALGGGWTLDKSRP